VNGRETEGARVAEACFVISALAALGLAVVYFTGGQPQLEGALLGIALGGLGVGLVVWAHRLLPHGPFEEHRERLATDERERRAFEDALERGGTIGRRKFLIATFVGSLGALGIAFLFPVRSLGPRPGNALERTPWRRGLRAVTDNGKPVRASEVPRGGLVTIFPEGHPGSADGQAVLVRVNPERIHAPAGRESWSPRGLLAYSRVCTHAGCPVGLYEAQSAQLLCPCHQSAFDVLHGGRPVFGPAARALPQLPLAIDDDGFVVARSDFTEPIGPAYWTRG
jgi:ubiquinol-cytochrome c reductase iron-sulfur subunit